MALMVGVIFFHDITPSHVSKVTVKALAKIMPHHFRCVNGMRVPQICWSLIFRLCRAFNAICVRNIRVCRICVVIASVLGHLAPSIPGIWRLSTFAASLLAVLVEVVISSHWAILI